MKNKEEILRDLENIVDYHEAAVAQRGYLRIIAGLLLDVRDQNEAIEHQNEEIIRAIQDRRLQ